MKNLQSRSLLHERLNQATEAELNKLCIHLSLKQGSGVEKILRAYQDAADNSFYNVVRLVLPGEIPTYANILRIIFKKMRPFVSAIDDSWQQVKFFKFWEYRSPVEDMSEIELEEKIYQIYVMKHADAKKKMISDPNFWAKIINMTPGVTTAAASTAVTVSATTASRLPFASIAPGAVLGPAGLALAVVLIGAQLSGPAFRKIIPATVELILIGRRIQFMPTERNKA